MGFAVWIDHHQQVVWAQGTHEYRPMGSAVIALQSQFLPRDFRQSLKRPALVGKKFIGFFASLEDVNRYLSRDNRKRRPRPTPAHLL